MGPSGKRVRQRMTEIAETPWGIVAKSGQLVFLTLAATGDAAWKAFDAAGETREPGMLCVRVDVAQSPPGKKD